MLSQTFHRIYAHSQRNTHDRSVGGGDVYSPLPIWWLPALFWHSDQRNNEKYNFLQEILTSRFTKKFNNSSSLAGGCCGSTSKKTVVGGWAWAWWLVTDVQRLSLEVNFFSSPTTFSIWFKLKSSHSCNTNFSQVMTLNPVCENVETAQGVPLTVTGVAQVILVYII